jgi:hypothetical protein
MFFVREVAAEKFAPLRSHYYNGSGRAKRGVTKQKAHAGTREGRQQPKKVEADTQAGA